MTYVLEDIRACAITASSLHRSVWYPRAMAVSAPEVRSAIPACRAECAMKSSGMPASAMTLRMHLAKRSAERPQSRCPCGAVGRSERNSKSSSIGKTSVSEMYSSDVYSSISSSS